MTDELITVASSAPMALRIHDIQPDPDPDKPAIRSEDSVVINGSGHPDAVNGLGITHGVNAGWFHNWMTAHPHLEGVLRAMTPEEFKAHADKPVEFGFEPGLAKLADDKDNTELASKGTESPEAGTKTEAEAEHGTAHPFGHDAPAAAHEPVEALPVAHAPLTPAAAASPAVV
jgi:hypothetical protein